jgi:hypothetical protein
VENNRRLVRQLVQRITLILREEKIDWWSFAAPAEIHEAVVKQLVPGSAIVSPSMSSDLVNTPS